MSLFFDWIIELIQSEQINVLLISGDIFDRTNPSSKDRTMYYQFLKRLIGLKLQVIITGGNHDSIGFLNAPGEILNLLDIHVIGGATNPIEDEIITIRDDSNQVRLVVAAVPFLRDKDLRNRALDQQYESRVDAIRAGIKLHYHQLGQTISESYPNTPSIAMGHLYATGAKTSESERDIHIGNAAAIEHTTFGDTFDYIALGHIHRPQRVNQDDFIRYSGSPIALSFSEKKDEKSVVILEINQEQLDQPKVIPVPKFRALKKIQGTLNEVELQLKNYTTDHLLPCFIELQVNEKDYKTASIMRLEEICTEYLNETKFQILKSKISFESGAKNTSDLFAANKSIEDLQPKEVFQKLLEVEEVEHDQRTALVTAFLEILEEAQQADD